MSTKPVKLADLDELNTQVLDAVLGKVKAHEIYGSIYKEIRRARSRLNVDREIQLRLMMARLEFFGKHKIRSERQCRAVLKKQPESVDAMHVMASIAFARRDSADAIQWLEAARQISERRGDFVGQLEALDKMIFAADTVDIAAIFRQMQELLNVEKEVDASQTSGAQWLLMNGRGTEALGYLEDLLRHILKRNNALKKSRTYGYLIRVVQSLVAVYCQHGLTFDEARAKVEEFRELYLNDDPRQYFDRAAEYAFSPNHYIPDPETFGIKPNWFEKKQA
ncbi:hypothetical protein LLG46_00195 [bacterium]|nr:hypothetical protein [bacterium]